MSYNSNTPMAPAPYMVFIMKLPFKTIFLIIVGLVFSHAVNSQEPLKIAHSNQGGPWAWKEQGLYKGLIVDIANEALSNRMNLEISHHLFPWKRAQHSVRTGVMDALITNYTEERKQYTIASSELITNIRRSIFVKKNNPIIPKLKDVQYLPQLTGYSMGNYSGNGWAEKNLTDMQVTWGNSSISVLKMLSHNRFDIYIANPISTRFKLKNHGINNIVMLPNEILDIKPSRFRLLIRKDSEYTEILPRFDEVIKNMKKEGTLQKIINKYQ